MSDTEPLTRAQKRVLAQVDECEPAVRRIVEAVVREHREHQGNCLTCEGYGTQVSFPCRPIVIVIDTALEES